MPIQPFLLRSREIKLTICRSHNFTEVKFQRSFPNFDILSPNLATMTFSKKLFIVAVAVLASFMTCKGHLHGDHHDHEDHHHDHGRLLKKPAKVKGAKPTKPTNGTKVIRCGTKDPTKAEMTTVNDLVSQHETTAYYPGGITIPIWFHIITDGLNGQLTDAQINQQLLVLNQRYSSMGIAFVGQGITRTDNSDWYYNCGIDNNGIDFPAAADMKKNLRQGWRDELYVYLVNLDRAGLLGYATFPWEIYGEDDPYYYGNAVSKDGVVLDNKTIPGGSAKGYNLGMTLVHEVGHWLGLLHTFTGGCSYSPTSDGDNVADTPDENVPAQESPDDGNCNRGRDTCIGPFYPGVDVST
jgi:hypothetical protein